MPFLLGILGTFFTPLLSLIGTIAPGIATTIGDTIIKAKQTQVESDKVGVTAETGWLGAVTEANRSRAEARKNEGAWGPIGRVTFGIGMCVLVHFLAVVLDSLPLLPNLTVVRGFVPWIELVPHSPCLCVAALPPKFQDAELEIVKSLFFVGPPSAAAIVVAKVFRK